MIISIVLIVFVLIDAIDSVMLIGTKVFFQAYRRPLDAVLEFKYLGRVLTAPDDYCPEVVENLRKARRRWAWMLRILGQEGVDPQDIRELLQGGGTGNPPARSRDLGNVLQDWEGPGRVPPQVGPSADKYADE